jgi:hypothetical protein
MKAGTFVYLVAGLTENRQGRLIGRERIRQEAMIRDDEKVQEQGCRTRVQNKGAEQGTEQGTEQGYRD